MKILKQVEIVIICKPLIFGQSMLSFGPNEKNNEIVLDSFTLASWPCQHHKINKCKQSKPKLFLWKVSIREHDLS